MSERQRIDAALALAREAYLRLQEWLDEPDHVSRRRLRSEATTLYQAAAEELARS